MSSEIKEVSSGDNSPATVTSNSPIESNSRETDDARLQIQTRIWIRDVLQKRLDEETDISDILADGTLLYELKEVLSGMLESNERKSFIPSTSLQTYKRFDYVGEFLEMCTIMGVAGIDLFSPSDVVDKKDTRKVCMCIRALSMKARSRGLNVPDFDNLTRSSVSGYYPHTPQSDHPFNGVIAEDYRLLDASNSSEIINTDDVYVINSFKTTIGDHQPGMESLRGIEGIEKVNTNKIETEHIKREKTPKDTPQRNWWKLVVKGTAILCIAVIVLHPRKSRHENVSQVRKQPVEVPKQSTPALLTENSQMDSKTSNIYPAEKLRFGF